MNRVLALVPTKHQLLVRQFLKFGITGTIGAMVDFGTYAFLTRVLDWTTLYNIAGFEISAANNVSVFLAIVSNFIINRLWTFRGNGGNVASQGLSYLLLNTFTWALNQFLLSFFAFKVPLFETLFGDQKDFVAKAAAIVIIMFVNFLGSKFLIFRKNN